MKRKAILCSIVAFPLAIGMSGRTVSAAEMPPDHEAVKKTIEQSIGWAIEKDFDRMFGSGICASCSPAPVTWPGTLVPSMTAAPTRAGRHSGLFDDERQK